MPRPVPANQRPTSNASGSASARYCNSRRASYGSVSGADGAERPEPWGRYRHGAGTRLFRLQRRLVAREHDSALQTLGGLQLMIELAFWAAHRDWSRGFQQCRRVIFLEEK